MGDLTLVTGACGYIGGHLVQQLIDAGRRVRAMVREPEQLAPAVRQHVETARGDIRDPDAVRAAMDGVHTVMHLAACASAWRPDPRDFFAINTGGTGQLLEAACGASVSRFVYCSTILASPPWRAAAVKGAAARLTPYEASKMDAERLVLDAARAGLGAVIVRPTRVYGPGPSTEANAVTRLLELYLAGWFRLRLDDAGALANYVHAADVAAGIRLAAERGASGAAYLLGGAENVSLAGLLRVAGELAGVRRRTVAVPASIGVALGRAAELWGALGGHPAITASWVRTFLEDRRGDISLSRADLGYAPRPLRVGVAETIEWLATRRAA